MEYSKEEVLAIVEAYFEKDNLQFDFAEWLQENGHPTAMELGFEGIGTP